VESVQGSGFKVLEFDGRSSGFNVRSEDLDCRRRAMTLNLEPWSERAEPASKIFANVIAEDHGSCRIMIA
jgi:hypothetical protein